MPKRIQFATNISQVTRRQIDSLRELGLTNREIVSLGVDWLWRDVFDVQAPAGPQPAFDVLKKSLHREPTD